MSAQTASRQRPGEAGAHEKAPRALRILGLVAVCLGAVAIAAATFVLSYSGIHTLALQARIAPRLARGYPLLIDAMLAVVLAAVLALRGAGLPSKIFAWITLLAVLAAAAAADALHAAGRKLPGHVAAVTVAVVPWVLVFLAFALLLAMLRFARIRRQAAARGQVAPHGEARAHWQPGDVSGLIPAPVAPILELPNRPPAPFAGAVIGAKDAPGHEGTQPTAAVPEGADAADAAHRDGTDTAVTDTAGADGTVADTAGADGTVADTAGADGTVADTAGADGTVADTAGADGTVADAADGQVVETAEDEAEPSAQPGLAILRQSDSAAVADAHPGFGGDGGDYPELAGEADEILDDPASDEAASQEAQSRTSAPDDEDDPDMPVFHRMWSAPTPPAEL